MIEPPVNKWYKSTRSETGQACVEVYHSAGAVGVRDSKSPGGPELWFAPEAWDAFLGSDFWMH
ncbi:DUF397 domain-containing protein [Nocardia sp. NPDC057668]|uniref:DUF397 domain-containing protein n=1 Tax=Nocardia sp. NPDC057668 TaxID=3346202 RepID=UPI00366D82AD